MSANERGQEDPQFGLDDLECHIPQVQTPPTLESILNEESDLADDFSFLVLDNGVPDAISVQKQQDEEVDEEDEEVVEAGHDGEAERDDIAFTTLSSHWIKDPPLPAVTQDPVLHSSVLRGVTAQILSAVTRVNGGTPTAIDVCGTMAVGTTTGQLLIFDSNQVLKLCLGNQTLGVQYGPISAVGFNSSATCILCGFAKGQILHWDVESGKLLRTITNVIPAGNSVVTLRFTSDSSVAVCSDSSGSVFELHFKKSLGARTWEWRCVWSNKKAAVRCISPLCVEEDVNVHSPAPHLPLAMVTHSKLLIVCQRPELRLICASTILQNHSDFMPSLCWRFLQVKNSAAAVLAFCQASCLSLYQVKMVGEEVKVVQLKDYSFQFEVLNCKWLNSSTFLIVDTEEKLHVTDRRSGEELEQLDLEGFQLVGTAIHLPGNEDASVTEHKKAAYHSVCVHHGEVTLLGNACVYLLSLKTWEERLDSLVAQERYGEAFSLAWKFYEGNAKAVVGLPSDIQAKKHLVAYKVAELLSAYVEFCLRRCPSQGKLQIMEEHFQQTIPLCVTCCVKFHKMDVLFGGVYEKLIHHIVALEVFFECLQPHISAGRLTSIPPLVMKDMVGHYKDQGRVELLDTLIPHLDVSSLDIHEIVSLSRQHGLVDALIYVFNKGLNDYSTPIQEVVAHLAKDSCTDKPDVQVAVGNKILVYISCCLTGRAYPFGAIPDNIAQNVKAEVFGCITSVQAEDMTPSSGPYPYIRTLLQYSTREFLNVLALAFEDLEVDKQKIDFHQKIINILLQVMLESTDFSPSQIGSLFTFLARQLAKAEEKLFVNHKLFHQALDFLCNPEDTTQHAERQQALLDLLHAGGSAYFEQNKLLSMAEAVQFYQVCEFLYEEKRLHHKIVACYLKDPARKEETLEYLYNFVSSNEFTEEHRGLFQNEIFCNLLELLALNTRQTSLLIVRHFQNCIPLIMETLQQDAKLQFDFLHGIFDPSVDPWPFKEASLMGHDFHEKYLELLCERHPDLVLNFVKLSDSFRPEEAIEITKKHGVHDALAYLLEMQGNTQGAFTVLMESFNSSLQSLLSFSVSQEGEGKSDDKEALLAKIRSMLQNLVLFCKRASGTLDRKQRETLWFPLLDFLMAPSGRIHDSLPAIVGRGIKYLTKDVLEAMTSYIPLMDILQKLIQDTSYSVGNYGEIKPLICGIIDAYVYEKTLLEATSSLLSQDLHLSLCSLRSVVTRGLASAHRRCVVCSQQYGGRAAGNVVLFSCGHVYHQTCLQSNVSEQQRQMEQWACFRCQSPAKKWIPITSDRRTQDPQIVELDQAQIAASECLKRAFKNPSRISVMMELTREKRSNRHTMDSYKAKDTFFGKAGNTNPVDSELKRAPPPLVD